MCALLAVSGGAVSACAPPPPVRVGPDGSTGPDASEGPSIEILYPEPLQQIELDATCTLTEPLIVYIEGLELVETTPPHENRDGQGHWHGGPSLERGYCASSIAFCEGSGSGGDFATYDGSGMSAGSLTLYVELQDNTHSPLGVSSQVEIRLLDPAGLCG